MWCCSRTLACVGAVMLGLGVGAARAAEARFALVIGNGAYKSGALQAPAKDAKAMASALGAYGFKVLEITDAGKAELESALLQAAEAMRGGSTIGLFYYSGHALQFGQRNYLVPVDARLAGPADVLANTLDMHRVTDVFERAGNRTNVFVLDASRDNSFSASASGLGLAQMEAPPGSFLAFAAAPGEIADDDAAAGEHSLYTRHLLAELKQPGTKIEDLFKRVRYLVRTQSHGRQMPWESTSLEEDFYFAPVAGDAEAAPASRAAQEGPGAQRARLESFRSEFVLGTTRFAGNFEADREGKTLSGTGKVSWADGGSFEGTLVAGKREGHGRYSWADGGRYEGQWRDDQPNGQGVLWFANGDVYEGTVENGRPMGQGRKRFASGDRHVGGFKAGIPHGRGVYTWTSGQTMVGLWVDGRVEGSATLRFVNGDLYEGQVAQGQPDGMGRMAFRSGDVYTGRFKGGRAEGEGTYSWPNGDRFVGLWSQGRREGFGVMTLRNGDRWEGIYKADSQAEGEWITAGR